MDFLGIGPGELLLIFVIALILFGPRRLPEIGRTLGKTIRDFRQASQDLSVQLRSELDSASEELNAASDELSGRSRPLVPQLPDAAPDQDVMPPVTENGQAATPRDEQSAAGG